MRTWAPLAVLLALAGCSSPTPVVSVTPTAATVTMPYACTPEEGGPAAPCTQAEYEAQVERERLYTEAETVYRGVLAASTELFRQGSPADNSVLQWVAGEATSIITDQHTHGVRYLSGEPQLARVERMVSADAPEGFIALHVCVDNSQTQIVDPDGAIQQGMILEQNVHFEEVDGELRLTFLESREVETC